MLDRLRGSLGSCGVLTVLLILVIACRREPPLELTASDAIDFGYEPVTCRNRPSIRVYVEPDSISTAAACSAFNTAVRMAATSDEMPESAMAADSIALAVVQPLRYAPLSYAPEFPQSGIQVTIDLKQRDVNVVVTWPVLDAEFEVGWAPEGLRY